MTERARRRRLDARAGGVLLIGLGLVAMAFPALWTTALALELVAAAFWVWARSSENAREQVPRWAWLRRPAMGLWLAAAVDAAFPGLLERESRHGAEAVLALVEAGAVAWSGLELLAALPLARPYSDLPGPLLAMRPWLPVLLPAAGFVVLWRHGPIAFAVPQIRDATVLLLLLTAALAAMRAFSRRKWTATLRWLAVTDSALAALVVAIGGAPREAVLLLWLAAGGGHAFLLAGELRGAAPRRGAAIMRLWRTASWLAVAGLSWPVLIAAGSPRAPFAALTFGVAVATVALAAWTAVGRMVAAPERRLVVRPNPAQVASQLVALLVLLLVPVALARAWWAGFEPPLRATVLALAPAALGGLVALAARQGRGRPFWNLLRAVGAGLPELAGLVYRLVVGLERRVVGGFARLMRGLTVPLNDLHAGDAQEYLLFLAGLAVLALTAPLLR